MMCKTWVSSTKGDCLVTKKLSKEFQEAVTKLLCGDKFRLVSHKEVVRDLGPLLAREEKKWETLKERLKAVKANTGQKEAERALLIDCLMGTIEDIEKTVS